MSQTEDEHNPVEALLAGAARTIRNVGYCWLVTEAEDGATNPRPMGRLLHDPDEDEWTIRFLTDGRSRKVADMRRTDRVAIIFQQAPDDAFVTLIGKGTLHDSASEVRQRWIDAYDTYFPSAVDRGKCHFRHRRRCAHQSLDPRRHARAIRTAYDNTRTRYQARLASHFR
jgi:general stress protein 26